MDILTYALAKSYTDKALLGVGTIKGAPCTVKSQTEDDEYVYVTLGWENNLGTSEETVVKIKKGADGAPGEPGPAGDPGPQGISITKIEKIKTEDLIDTYQISFSDNTTFEYTISNGSTDYLNITNKPSIEGVELIGNKTFEDLNIASADALSATDKNLQNLSNLIGDKTSLPAPTDTVVNNIASVDAKVDAIIDDNETGLAKTFSSDKITKTFATIEEVNKRILQYNILPAPTEAFGGKIVQFIGATTEDYIHNYFYECVEVEGSYKWVNVEVQNVPTKVSELTNDSNFVTETELNAKGYLTEHQDISGKVDKEEGKSLIADSEITRLSTVKNYDDSVVKEDIATIKTDYATKTYVGEQIASADHLKREIVTEVPTAETAAENVIYMLKVESAIGADKYKEYMLIDGEVACVGDTSVDLTDYAKKSEIPTELPANGGNADTVNTHTVASDVPENAVFTDTWRGIQDNLTSTSTSESLSANQGRILNSHLTNLKVSDVAGGKNLADINAFKQLTIAEKSDRYGYEWLDMKGGSYTFTITNNGQRVYLGYEHEGVVTNPYSIGDETANFTITISDHDNIAAWYDENVKINTITKIQLEEGTQATDYEPYIPSVKTLAEEVGKQNDSLENYGFDNKCTELGQGYGNFANDDNTFVWTEQEGYFVGTKSPIDCNSGDRIKVKFDIIPDNIVVQWNDGTHSRVDGKKELVATAPSGVTKFCVYCSKSDITPQSVGYIGIYVNNGIDILSDNQIEQKMLGWNVPSECPIQNYADSDGVFHQRVGRVDLGSLNWKYETTWFHAFLYDSKPQIDHLTKANIYCSVYDTDVWSKIGTVDKTIGVTYTYDHSIGITDTSYTDATAFKNAMQGVYLYYELATPITMTIDGNEAVTKVNESLSVIGKCKNLLNPTLQTTTLNGVTCTNNGDGTYTLNGTASGLTTFILRDMKLDSSLSYKLTGCPLGGDWDNGYSMYVEKQYWGIDIGKGCEITLTDAGNICGVYIRIIKDTVCNNLVFKPMITTDLSATYDDFVPYTGDGETLTHDVAELNNNLDKLNSLPKGSIIQIDADKDNIETTKQKYGWQYLGTSNIQYESGSANILVTNVYRKNN